jgi:nitronate monooxygenase
MNPQAPFPRIWLAPMAGEAAAAPLVAAVCEAGGMGWLGGAYLPPERLGAVVDEIRARTAQPFGVNLFCPQPWARDAAREAAFAGLLAPWHAAHGLPPPAVPERVEEDFEAQLAVLVARRVPWIGFTFGDPGAARVAALHATGLRVVGTATNVPEARALAASGCDAVVAQGAEAGGHRGSFAGAAGGVGARDAALVGTMALVPQVVDAVPVPVVAAGGVADARGVAASQALGASAVALGTAFLLADECPLSGAYRDALAAGAAHDTVLTAGFSGRWARGLANRFTRETQALAERGGLPDFPLPNAMTRPLRQAAARAGDAQALSLWAGQGLPLARRAPAAEIVRRLAAGWKER